ncbi:hypothetical protein [Clostridium gasigenes]|uniref:Uncharacterized protein n=1 Tax=Clostridium gasigenes TaxID=94869 RepID=A0A1H0W7Q5_9CLOT|nr:hypothetical protein [Clostridium gasigenes]MBB6624667.1 hypothetical protein [Clostridium gasigenes]SDP86767.1 hypothetical protein SAMN04488529_1401 [Clostridium gasigenes]
MDKEILEILKSMQDGIKRLESKFDGLEQGQKEIYQIVKALEHSSEVNKAEHDSMSNDIAQIKGDVSAIKKDLLQVEMVTANNWADITNLKAAR